MEFQLDHAKEILVRTPATLNSLLRHLPEEWTLLNEGPDSWSPFDVVGHLIHGEEADWIPRARIILEYGEQRTFEPFDRFPVREVERQSLGDLLTGRRLRGESLKEWMDERKPETLEKRGMIITWDREPLQLLRQVGMTLATAGKIVRVMAKQSEA